MTARILPSNDRRRRIAAAAVLTAGLAIPPAALALTIGWSLPRSAPSLDQIRDALSDTVTARGLVSVLAVMAWALWLQFTACVAAEAHAALSARPRLAVRIPASAPTQALARRLVIAALLTGAATALTPAEPAAASGTGPFVATAPPLPGTTLPSLAQTGQVQHQDTDSRYTVKPGDTLWDIARTHLGDGRRYQEIYQLNTGQTFADGRRLTDPDIIQPGWQLRLPPADQPSRPAADARTYTIKPGDNLWDIAEMLLGDGYRYREIYQLNAGRTFPDGRTLTNPDLIQPGWDLLIPVPPANAPARAPAEPASPPDGSESTATPSPAASPPSTGPAGTASAPSTAAGEPTVAPGSAPPAATSTTRPTSAPSATSTAPTTALQPDGTQAVPIWQIAGYSAFAASGILAALAAKRLIQQRRRRSGQRIRMPAMDTTEFETHANLAADAIDPDLVNRALRTLARNAHASGHPLPRLHAVRADREGFVLHLAEETEPIQPFTPIGQRVWACPASADLLDTEASQQVPAPYPALVTIGHDLHGSQVLIDLAETHELALTGDHADAVEVLHALAIELAAAQLANDLCVSLVGCGHELANTRLATGRLIVSDDLDAAIAELATWARTQTEALRTHGLASARHAHPDHIGPDAWTPHILLTATPPDHTQAARLADILTAEPAGNIAAVTTRPVTPGACVLPAAPAPITLPGSGLSVAVQRIDQATYRQLVEHLAVANDATPVRHADQPIDDGAYDNTSDASDGPPATAHPFAEPETDTEPAHPEIRILGPAEIAGARGECEPGKQTRLTEIAAWLVLHPGRDHRAITKAIWPLGTTTNNRNSFISKLRSWLGNDDNGNPYLPTVGDAGYLLTRQVRCDWLRFRHLAHRGMQQGGPEGAADVTAALRLVRGEPFTVPVGGTRYAWAEPLRQHITSVIVDAAAWLAEHHLNAQEWRPADAAAQAGLRAAPGAEQLWRLRFQALHHAGDHVRLQAAIAELDQYNEANGLDVEPETVNLLQSLTTSAAV